MTDEVQFLVQGSDPEPYAVTFHRRGSELRASCTCRAGQFGSHCKHRIAILIGNPAAIVSENEEDCATVAEWLNDSPWSEAVAEFVEAERVLGSAKRRVAKAKKQMSRMMTGAP